GATARARRTPVDRATSCAMTLRIRYADAVTVRLRADAAHAVDEARRLARRYQHRVVDLEHLLLAMLTANARPPLPAFGVSGPELRIELETRLAARTRTALYRDPREVI